MSATVQEFNFVGKADDLMEALRDAKSTLALATAPEAVAS